MRIFFFTYSDDDFHSHVHFLDGHSLVHVTAEEYRQLSCCDASVCNLGAIDVHFGGVLRAHYYTQESPPFVSSFHGREQHDAPHQGIGPDHAILLSSQCNLYK